MVEGLLLVEGALQRLAGTYAAPRKANECQWQPALQLPQPHFAIDWDLEGRRCKIPSGTVVRSVGSPQSIVSRLVHSRGNSTALSHCVHRQGSQSGTHQAAAACSTRAPTTAVASVSDWPQHAASHHRTAGNMRDAGVRQAAALEMLADNTRWQGEAKQQLADEARRHQVAAVHQAGNLADVQEL
ncbi:hypothetical protein MRX96_015466 [Rhipicephalus microplus]